MEAASSPGNTSLEGVWHQAARTDQAWKFAAVFSATWILCAIIAELFMAWYYSSHNILWLGDHSASFLGRILALLFILPITIWLDRNKVAAMLRFDDAGIAVQLKGGLVLEAGWNLVRSVKYDRRGKLSVIRLRGVLFPFTGNFPIEVNAALMAKLARMRQGPSEPTVPTLEDMVDKRLAANIRT